MVCRSSKPVCLHVYTHTHCCEFQFTTFALWAAFVENYNKIVSAKHNNILVFILTYWRQVSVFRPSSGHPYQ